MAAILVLERDSTFRKQLEQALSRDFDVTTTPMMREACLIIAARPQHLAFISADEGAGAIAALRRLQPDLPVVLTASSATTPAVTDLAGEMQVQAVLLRDSAPEQAVSLASALLSGEPAVATGGPAPEQPGSPEPVGIPPAAAIAARLRMELDDGMVSGLLLGDGADLLAYAGDLDEARAGAVARLAGRSWQPGGQGAAVLQFVRLPATDRDLLLYSRRVGSRFLLTLVAAGPDDVPLARIRAKADRLAAQLAAAYEPAAYEPAAYQPGAESAEPACHAVVWRPLVELPPVMHAPLSRALTRSARAIGCELVQADITADYVHVLVRCLPAKESSWIAGCLKERTEQELQRQFGIHIALWSRGHFAAPRDQPFAGDELAVYLQEAYPAAGEAARSP